MKKILMTRLSVCSLGVSCNDMIDTPMLLVVVVTHDVSHQEINKEWCSYRKKAPGIQWNT